MALSPEDREFEVLLAEYKAHYDEVYKWHSYRHQALGGYFLVLSIFATIIKDKLPEYAFPVTLALLSAIFLYVLFQYRFAIVRNVIYIHSHIAPRLRELSTKKILDDLQFCSKYRRSSGSGIEWLTKFGVEIVPFVALVSAIPWILVLVFSGKVTSPLHVVLSLILVVACLTELRWLCLGYYRIGKDEEQADKYEREHSVNVENVKCWRLLCTFVVSFYKANLTRKT